MGRKGPIPERWEDYKPVGVPIKGTRIIAFKVPLRPTVYDKAFNSAKERWLDCDRLLDMVPNLGLIIDLTFTSKYYEPSVFTRRGVEHLKIMLEGKQLPQPYQMKIFNDRISKFLRENRKNNLLIGVHCTHGVNRTGFLICFHLITMMNMSAESAINSFEEARGHRIERPIYTNFLKRCGAVEEVRAKDREVLKFLINSGAHRSLPRADDRRNEIKRRSFDRDHDNDDWRAGPRNFARSTAQISGSNRRGERNQTRDPPQQRETNYYAILSHESSQNDRRNSNDDSNGRASSSRWGRTDYSHEQTSSRRESNRDNYRRYARRDESFENGRNRSKSPTIPRRYASKDRSPRNGRDRDFRQDYVSKDRSPRNERNRDNYQRYASRDESCGTERTTNNYRGYATKDEHSYSERNHDNYQSHVSKNEYPDYNVDRPKDTRRRFEMLPEFARRSSDAKGMRPLRSEGPSAYRYSPTM